MGFGRRLKFLRQQASVPLAKLAAAIGVDRELLRDMEAERKPPAEHVVASLARYFDVKPEYFTAPERDRRPEQQPHAAAPRSAGRTEHGLRASDFAYFSESPPVEDAGLVTLGPAPPSGSTRRRAVAMAVSDPAAASDRSARVAPSAGGGSRPAVPATGAPPRPASAAAGAPPSAPPTAAPAPCPTDLAQLIRGASSRALLCAIAEVLVTSGACTAAELAEAVRRYS